MANEIKYYGVAARGRDYGILLVTKRIGERSTQEWTGERVASWSAAQRRVEQLNRELLGDSVAGLTA